MLFSVLIVDSYTHFAELLRKSSEHTLVDMVQLLFSRLPQFKEDPKWATSIRKVITIMIIIIIVISNSAELTYLGRVCTILVGSLVWQPNATAHSTS